MSLGKVAIVIKRCRLCGDHALVPVLTLGSQHVSDFVTAGGTSPRSPLELVRCTSCNLVQLKHTFPREMLYRHYWYRSGISSTMRAALADIATKATRVGRPLRGDIVVDIGCNDGTLLRSYRIPGARLVGFEPAKNLIKDASRGTSRIINDFFTYESFRHEFPGLFAKLITSIAMFYDLNDPNRFVADIARTLHHKGVWVVQQNYLPLMLEKNGFDNIGHEHLTYYSLETMNRLVKRHGLEIFDVETNDVNGGSFRTYIGHRSAFPVTPNVRKMKEYERRLFSRRPSIYRTFSDNVGRLRETLHNFVAKQVQAGKTVYVYGASTRGNTILQFCELDHRLIKRATDANPEKWGRKTPGTGIPIVSKARARKDKPDYFLVLPHHFIREIARDEKTYLQSGGRLIVPLPRFRIIAGRTR